EVQRAPAAVDDVERTFERGWILVRAQADRVDVADRNRRVQGMPRAVREQIPDDIRLDLDAGKNGRPSDDVETVIVGFAGGRLRAMLDEKFDDRQMAALGRKVQRERVVTFVTDIRIRTAFEQRPDDLDGVDADMQGGA